MSYSRTLKIPRHLRLEPIFKSGKNNQTASDWNMTERASTSQQVWLGMASPRWRRGVSFFRNGLKMSKDWEFLRLFEVGIFLWYVEPSVPPSQIWTHCIVALGKIPFSMFFPLLNQVTIWPRKKVQRCPKWLRFSRGEAPQRPAAHRRGHPPAARRPGHGQRRRPRRTRCRRRRTSAGDSRRLRASRFEGFRMGWAGFG